MSFLRTYVSDGFYKEGGNAGLTAVKKAQAAGMSINDILAASRNQGFGFGSKAQNFIDSNPEFFKKFVDSGSTTHAGLNAVNRAEAAGMSIDQIRNASKSQGFSFGSQAQQYLDQQSRDADVQDRYQQQFATLQQQMNQQQESYNSRLTQMTNTLKESQAQTKAALMAANQSGTKESVLGVKAATSKESPDIKKLTRAGMKGSFNRQGLRIKGINVG